MFPIVGKKFSPEDFAQYVKSLSLGDWQPEFIVIHNTASPSLAQRPSGLTHQHIKNLQTYYAGKGWKGGPHLFVDDTGIWVFNPLDKRGTHSPSWNSEAWGIELLGDYSTESPTEGRGELVIEDGAKAAGILLRKLGLEPNDKTIRFHKEDPETTHDCPGKLLVKSEFIKTVKELGRGATTEAEPDTPAQKWVKENGISDGSRPNDVATRSEIWEMLRRLEQKRTKT